MTAIKHGLYSWRCVARLIRDVKSRASQTEAYYYYYYWRRQGQVFSYYINIIIIIVFYSITSISIIIVIKAVFLCVTLEVTLTDGVRLLPAELLVR